MASNGRDRVAVIGAGPVGLTALKQFREDGFDAVAFETRSYVGGLWKDSPDSSTSVQGTTVFNTSRFRAPMSDFPFPADVDAFPTAYQVHAYLEAYAAHFKLNDHISLNTRAFDLRRCNGKWTIKLEDLITKHVRVEEFDRVCVATGTFHTPRGPTFDGIERFEGNVIHSIHFHGGTPFKGQNVLIIGMHATAQDCVNSLSDYAQKAYLSHRDGVVLLPAYTPEGRPTDATIGLAFTILMVWLEKHLPTLWAWLFDKIAYKMGQKAFPGAPKSWGLRPAKSLQVSTPLMGDILWRHLQSGFAEPVPAVRSVTGPRTVELSDGRVLEDIDAIIYCTGYESDIPEDLIQKANDDSKAWYHPFPDGAGTIPFLYRNVYPLTADEDVRRSLSFLGLAGFALPGFLQHELQAMAISQIWQGKSNLPTPAEALQYYKDQANAREYRAKRYDASRTNSTFYPVMLQVSEALPWLDETAGTGIFANLGGIGNGLFNIKAWSLWWRDRELYNTLMKGVCSPVIFRVFDMGKRKPLDRGLALSMLKQENQLLERSGKIQQAASRSPLKAD